MENRDSSVTTASLPAIIIVAVIVVIVIIAFCICYCCALRRGEQMETEFYARGNCCCCCSFESKQQSNGQPPEQQPSVNFPAVVGQRTNNSAAYPVVSFTSRDQSATASKPEDESNHNNQLPFNPNHSKQSATRTNDILPIAPHIETSFDEPPTYQETVETKY